MTDEQALQNAWNIALYLLPPSAGKIEKAVLTAELVRLLQIDPAIINTIWDPWKCPCQLLPFLAHAVSVDVWSDDWSELQKRKVIAASPTIHRLKGTRGAIDRALKAFNLDTRVIEWWEDDARRGTFRVEMFYYDGGPVFDLKLQQYAIDSVIAAKPKARIFTSKAIISARANLYSSAYPKGNFVRIAHPYQFKVPVISAAHYVAAVPVLIFSITAHPKGVKK